MLKANRLSDVSGLDIENNNDKVIKFGISSGSNVELAMKLEKLKSHKLSQSQKLLKSRNSFRFTAKKVGSNLLIFDTKTTFNCL